VLAPATRPGDLCIVNASRDIVRPDLSAVQDAQNSNPIGGYNVGGDEGRTRNHKLARPGYSAGAAALRKVEKPPQITGRFLQACAESDVRVSTRTTVSARGVTRRSCRSLLRHIGTAS
jgi:hypothetical protein